MKLKLAIASTVLALSGYASAAGIVVACSSDLDFSTNTSDLANAIDSTYTVKVGVYSGGLLSTTATFSDINASWAEIGNAPAATGVAYNGWFNTGNLAFTDGDGFTGENVWVWVTNGSDQNILLQALNSGAGDFLYKADADIPSSGTVSFSSANVASWAIALGSYDSGGANAAYGGSYVLNTAVPEPSALLLGAFGVVGLVRRRRA